MSEQTIFNLLLGIISFDFIFSRILDILNRKSAKKPIPEGLEGIYNDKEYAKSRVYQSELSRFGTFTAIFAFIILLLTIYNGWFGMLDRWVSTLSSFDWASPIFFFGVLYIISDVINIPFSLYRNFVIEAKYGFNKMTVRTFIFDKIKGYIMTALIGGILLLALIYFVKIMGSDFWMYFWGLMTAFMLFANLFYTSLILPLFNKLIPIAEGELKSSIKSYCKKIKFPLKNIFIMDGSRRSSKGNAFFSGLGKRKKVVLFDTLIEKHTTKELTAIFAHEAGHYKKKHVVFSMVYSIGMTGFMLYLFSQMADNVEVSKAMGGLISAIHLNLLAFGILYSPISTILGIIGNIVSRKNEYEADAYAKETYDGNSLVTGLKKMSADHLSNLTPHPVYVFVHYSHPSLKERIKALEG